MRNISTAVRGHYDDDGYMWAIIIRRFCDIGRADLWNRVVYEFICSGEGWPLGFWGVIM
jgi:hypothetical protein